MNEKLVSAEELYRIIAPIYGCEIGMKELFKLERSILQKLIPPLKNKLVLDVGCGTGRWTAYFVKKGARVIGLDISAEMLKIARKKVPNAKFKLGDVRNLPFPSNYFDFTFASFVLGHLRAFRKAYKEMIRVTKPGGVILVSDLHGARVPRDWKPPFKIPFQTPSGEVVYTKEWPIYPSDLIKIALRNCQILALEEVKCPSFWKAVGTKPKYTPILLILKVQKR